MELKKSESANIEKLRAPLVVIGLLFVGSVVLASFSYKAGVLKDDLGSGIVGSSDVKLDVQNVETPPPPPDTPPPAVDVPPPVTEEVQ